MAAILLTMCICGTVAVAMLAQAVASVNEADARALEVARNPE